VYIEADGANGQAFLQSVHGRITCQTCHGGAEPGSFETMVEAHTGLVRDPSAVGKCEACHRDQTTAAENSLHGNLWGEIAAIETRSGVPLAGSPHEPGFEAKCATCHTTCGQCHVSRPNSVGGGFPGVTASSGGIYYSHRFQKTPSMDQQCTACHGSRIAHDYLGQAEGNVADVHYSKGRRCEFCHSGTELHGDGMHDGDHYTHRYEVKTMPRCEECHTVSPNDNEFHAVHVDGFYPNLQCQVCHSQPYKNCTNCHNLGASEYDIDPSVLDLKIARNPNPFRSEYEYTLVRHTPVDPNTFADWGLSLPDYSDRPTWQYTSPHNVIRNAPQTQWTDWCGDACHESDYWLRESDLYDSGGAPLPDYDANRGIVIE
jgi:thiosulfate/3-mercaptopyruvate sulfurtransferase